MLHAGAAILVFAVCRHLKIVSSILVFNIYFPPLTIRIYMGWRADIHAATSKYLLKVVTELCLLRLVNQSKTMYPVSLLEIAETCLTHLAMAHGRLSHMIAPHSHYERQPVFLVVAESLRGCRATMAYLPGRPWFASRRGGAWAFWGRGRSVRGRKLRGAR